MDPFEQPQRPRSTPIPGIDQPMRPGPPPAPAYAPPGAQPIPPPAPPPGAGWAPAPPPGAYPGMPGAYPGMMPGMAPGPGGWGASAPFGRSMIRKRRPVVLVIGLLLLVGGIVAGAIGVLGIIDAVSIPDDEIAVRGATGQTMQYERAATDPTRWTIYLDSGSSNSDLVDQQTASTRCAVTMADGTTATINGSRQTTSVNINGTASIGWFDAPVGPVSVRCESSLGDYSLFVAEGGPRFSFSDIGILLGGVAAVVLGIILTIVGARRRWVAAPVG